jgi:putative PEP-CTERM system histidine kinase
VATGIFVIFISTLSYFVLPYSEDWGATLQQVITFIAIISLTIVSVVPRWRSFARVFITKHFFTHKYDYRAEWLKSIDILSRPVEKDDLEQRVIEVMLRIFDCNAGALWLHNHDVFSPVASYGMPVPVTASEPDDSDFIFMMRKKEWIFDAFERRFPEDRTLPEWAQTIDGLWVIVPLLSENRLIGFVGLDRKAGIGSGAEALSWEDLDLLKTVGRQLGNYVARHQAAESLSHARQFEAYNQLTAFIMHDLKNLIAQQTLVVANWQKHKANPAFIEDSINTIENSVQRMNSLLSKIQRREPDSNTNIYLDGLLVEVVDKCSSIKPVPVLRVLQQGLNVQADRESLMMILIHLVNNAQEASKADGFIHIRQRSLGNSALIELEDTGCGMSENFIRNQLFRPFSTTKEGNGMGIGVYQAQEYLRAIGGDMTVSSLPQQGSTFRLTIPLVSAG